MAENTKPQGGTENTYEAPELSEKALKESRKMTAEFKKELEIIIASFNLDTGGKLDSIVGKKKIELLNKTKKLDDHINKIEQVSFVLEGQKSELLNLRQELENIKVEAVKITEDLKEEIDQALKECDEAKTKKELGDTAQAWKENVRVLVEGEEEKKKQMAEWEKQKNDLVKEKKELENKQQSATKTAVKGKSAVAFSAEDQNKLDEIKVKITKLNVDISNPDNKPKNIDVNKVKSDYLKNLLRKSNEESKLLKTELEKSKSKKPKFFEHLSGKALEKEELQEMLLILDRWESERTSIKDNSVDISKEKDNLLSDLSDLESMLTANQNIKDIKIIEAEVNKTKTSINNLNKDSDPDDVINFIKELNSLKVRLQKEIDTTVGEMSKTRVKGYETEVKKKKKNEKQEKNIEIMKVKSKEIPASLLADFVEADKASSSKAVAETVNYILATELKDFANTNPDSSSYIEAIENMFDSTAPNAELIAKLQEYGIKDWDSFVKVWKGGLAKEKVAPVMEAWLRGEMKRQAVAGLDKASKMERFKSLFVDFNKKPIAAKVLLSLVAVGGGVAGGMYVFSGLGISTAVGGAVGVGVMAVARTCLRRFTKELEVFKKLDKKTAESFSEYGNKKQTRMTNKFIESAGKDIAEKYFGITQTTQQPAQKKGLWGKVKGVFGKKDERQVQEIEAGQGIDSEGALTMGAIISQSLQDKEPVVEGQEYEINGKKIILDAKTNSILLDVAKQFVEGGVDIADSLKIKNELILKLYELQNAEQKAMTEKGWDNKLSKYIDGFLKTLGGNVDGKIKGYGGAFVAGSTVGFAMGESSMFARLGLGAAGGLTLSTKVAESGYKLEIEQKAKGELIKNFSDLQKNLNNHKNLSDEEKKNLKERLQNLELAKNAKGGDLGEILALQENPLLAIKVDALLKESKEKGILVNSKEKELNFDFSNMEKVSQSLKNIDKETVKRFNSVDSKVIRKITRTQQGKRALIQLVGVVGMGAVAFGLGLGVQYLHHEFTSLNTENKLDDLLAGKSGETKAVLLDKWAGKDINSLNELDNKKLHEINQILGSEHGAEWLNSQIKEIYVPQVNNILSGLPEGVNTLGLVQYWSQNPNAHSVADLSPDKLQEILKNHNNNKWWLDQEDGMKKYESSLSVGHESLSKVGMDVDKLHLIGSTETNIGNLSKIVTYEVTQNSKGANIQSIIDEKMNKLQAVANDLTGGNNRDLAKVTALIEDEINKSNGNLDSVIDKLNQTVGHHEGISHAIMRQLEADPAKFGYKPSDGNIHNWAQNKAGYIVRDNDFYGDNKDVHVKNAYTGSVKVNFDESTGKFELDRNIETDNLEEVTRSRPVVAENLSDADNSLKVDGSVETNTHFSASQEVGIPSTHSDTDIPLANTAVGAELEARSLSGSDTPESVSEGQKVVQDKITGSEIKTGETKEVIPIVKETSSHIKDHIEDKTIKTAEKPQEIVRGSAPKELEKSGSDTDHSIKSEVATKVETIKIGSHNSLDFSQQGKVQILSDQTSAGFESRAADFRQQDFAQDDFTRSVFSKESITNGLARNGLGSRMMSSVIPTRLAQLEVYSQALDSGKLNASQEVMVQNVMKNISRLTWGPELNKVFGASFLDKMGLDSDGAGESFKE